MNDHNARLPVVPDISDDAIADPPPPYPDPTRRHNRTSRSHRASQVPGTHDLPYSDDEDDAEASENTLFIRAHTTRHSRHHSRNTTFSDAVLSLFHDDEHSTDLQDQSLSFTWKSYFIPLRQTLYYQALLHLLVLNFPYALLAWIYLFVFTVTGTTTLIALPLGAILCFLDLLGARAFSRGELYLQTRFHQLNLPSYQPRPLFTRLREPSVTDHESRRVSCDAVNPTRFRSVKEHSFYKNTYAMFTDPTSYQALFYFLVIKPAITLLITLLLIAFGLPLLILILPAPIVLRAVRKVGMWQANIAVEGLYHAVR